MLHKLLHQIVHLKLRYIIKLFNMAREIGWSNESNLTTMLKSRF